MNLNNRKWVIVNYSDVTDEMIDNSNEGSRNTLRHTVTGTDKVILKWDGDTPEVFKDMTSYGHSEILTILGGSDWTEPIG